MRLSIKTWTAREVAFIILFADYCLLHKQTYKHVVAHRLQMFSQRVCSYGAIEKKISQVLKNAGMTDISVSKFAAGGSNYVDITILPSEIRAELGGVCEVLDLSLPGVYPEPPSRSSLGALESASVSDDEAVSGQTSSSDPV